MKAITITDDKLHSQRLPPRWYVSAWRILMLATLAALLFGALGACWGYETCTAFVPYPTVNVAKFAVANWWLITILFTTLMSILGTLLILFDSRQPAWGRVGWAILCLPSAPFFSLAYWVDCVERRKAGIRARATRIATVMASLSMLAGGVEELLVPAAVGWTRGAQIALGCLELLLFGWLLLRGMGWRVRLKERVGGN